MTVISAMKFSELEGAMIADSMATNESKKREYTFSEKIFAVEYPQAKAYLGGAGCVIGLVETKSMFQEVLASLPEKETIDAKVITEALSAASLAVHRKWIEHELASRYNITSEQVLVGEGIHPEILSDAINIIKGESDFHDEAITSSYIVLAKDAYGVSLSACNIAMPAITLGQPYMTTGSGSETTDHILLSYISTLKRAERKQMDPIKSIAELIRATNAAEDQNIGVGGLPMIAYVLKEKHGILDEDATRLACEIVRVAQADLITKKVMLNSLGELIYNDTEPLVIEKDAFGKKYLEIMRFLRGYK